MKNIYINSNNNIESKALADDIFDLLIKKGFEVSMNYSKEAEFAISVGGDGAFLRTLQNIKFSKIPVLGVNTGHVGFFTELTAEEYTKIPKIISDGKYIEQKYRTIATKLTSGKDEKALSPAINDVLIQHDDESSLIHLKLSIGNCFIENFNGDGVLVSSSAGSTAYNYALGGAIVDPSLKLLQVAPLAPVNNNTYRSFTSSILLPDNEEIVIEPENKAGVKVIIDGQVSTYQNIKKISISLSKKEVLVVRLPSYNFWGKVKTKYL